MGWPQLYCGSWLEEPAPSRILLLLWAPSVPVGRQPAKRGSAEEEAVWTLLRTVLADHGYVVTP